MASILPRILNILTTYMKAEDMQIFYIFSRVIRGLPGSAIVRALDAECEMLEEDVEHYRAHLTEDILSILCFRGFVRMAKADSVMHCCLRMPPDHLEFYKETIARLIQEGELPPSAKDQFDDAFIMRN
jgi:hypothetical protein